MKIKKIATPLISLVTLFFTPLIIYAQNFTYIYTFLDSVATVLFLLLPVLVGLALVMFVWGLVVFIAQSGNDQAREVGKQRMIWGLVALFIIVSVWGIVLLLQELFGVDSNPGGLTPPVIL